MDACPLRAHEPGSRFARCANSQIWTLARSALIARVYALAHASRLRLPVSSRPEPRPGITLERKAVHAQHSHPRNRAHPLRQDGRHALRARRDRPRRARDRARRSSAPASIPSRSIRSSSARSSRPARVRSPRARPRSRAGFPRRSPRRRSTRSAPRACARSA